MRGCWKKYLRLRYSQLDRGCNCQKTCGCIAVEVIQSITNSASPKMIMKIYFNIFKVLQRFEYRRGIWLQIGTSYIWLRIGSSLISGVCWVASRRVMTCSRDVMYVLIRKMLLKKHIIWWVLRVKWAVSRSDTSHKAVRFENSFLIILKLKGIRS